MFERSFTYFTIENIGIKDILSYEEMSVQILDRHVRKLRTNEVASIKVLRMNQFVEEATWEADEDMKKRYPHLFLLEAIPDQDTYFRIINRLFVDTTCIQAIFGEPPCFLKGFTLISFFLLRYRGFFPDIYFST